MKIGKRGGLVHGTQSRDGFLLFIHLVRTILKNRSSCIHILN